MILRVTKLTCQGTLIIILAALLWGCSPGNSAYDEVDGVANIRLELTQRGLEKLNESVYSGEEADCLFYEDDGYPLSARIKVRGDMTRLVPKKSYSLKTADTNYAMDASYFEPSLIRNRLCLEAYADMGLPVPESVGTALYINGMYAGFYTRTERYREGLLEDYFSTDQVEMYKGWFINMGYDTPLQCQSEKKIPEGDEDYSSLVRLLIEAVNLNDSDWIRFVGDEFHIEETARYLAVHNYLAVIDTHTKNFNIARADGRYLLLPWDHEASLGRYPDGSPFDLSQYPYGGDNILTRRLLMAGSPVKARYDEIMDDYFKNETTLIAGETARTRWSNRARTYMNRIDKAVRADEMRKGGYADFLAEKNWISDFFAGAAARIP